MSIASTSSGLNNQGAIFIGKVKNATCTFFNIHSSFECNIIANKAFLVLEHEKRSKLEKRGELHDLR